MIEQHDNFEMSDGFQSLKEDQYLSRQGSQNQPMVDAPRSPSPKFIIEENEITIEDISDYEMDMKLGEEVNLDFGEEEEKNDCTSEPTKSLNQQDESQKMELIKNKSMSVQP